MNKHARLVATLLFVVIIILAAAITQFYLNVPDNISDLGDQTEIVHRLDSDSSGNVIFSDGSGKFGLADSGDRIVAAPEWNDLSFAGAGRCIAAKRSGSKNLYGCIDYEGNIVTPFIYSKIERLYPDGSYYSAKSASDGSFVLYNDDFSPCFRRTWSSCEVSGDKLILTDGSGVYSYFAGKDGLLFISASLEDSALECPYSIEIYSRVLLSKLTPSMIESMSECTGKYIEYAFSGDDELLSEITTGSRSGFVPLFPDDHRLLSKCFTGISDVHIYSVRSPDSVPRYEVSFTAKLEIVYTDENGEAQLLRGSYKAAVEFSGSSEHDLKALSGSFEKEAPDYPEPEPKDEPAPDDGEQTDENTI